MKILDEVKKCDLAFIMQPGVNLLPYWAQGCEFNAEYFLITNHAQGDTRLIWLEVLPVLLQCGHKLWALTRKEA